jgi:hypothetical protein
MGEALMVQYAGFWYGDLSRLYRLPDRTGSLETTDDEKPSYFTPLGGGRQAIVPLHFRPMRTWRVSIPRLTNQEYGQIQTARRHTPAPWWWVTPDAAEGNVLTPAQADFDNVGDSVVPTGVAQVEPGLWVPSAALVGSGPHRLALSVPVIGPRVTVSMWIQTQGVADVRVRDINGTDWATYGLSPAQTTGWQRVYRTFTRSAPFDLGVSGPDAVAGIAVTWSEELTDWVPGLGCASAQLTELADSLQQVGWGPGTLRDVSFSMVEIG